MTYPIDAGHARSPDPTGVRIASPALVHGAGMWRVAADSGELDLNSSYMYLLFARDFAATCRVALVEDRVVGYVLGYRRPDDAQCLFVWQIAVDEDQRGRGLAGRLLDDLVDSAPDGSPPVRFLETTITDDNSASQRLFQRLARTRRTSHETTPLLDAGHFPDLHHPERLHRIGPLVPASDRPGHT
ncbi:diaminobutyrate acetyltransferase [Microbacterium elymi]|uniref:L-2,4-diaminobutyric acid acetyltransferase n=1 Tax=Microbacterium elymi TaxID=2909587 RepID=A0ABY5NJT8_9MICO|nr:diaminobutyrate acetyltransferase [Microbacterium elymi]UUT35386.1 diaminobutyrate acetyltransferase [Microbacterium elymi]